MAGRRVRPKRPHGEGPSREPRWSSQGRLHRERKEVCEINTLNTMAQTGSSLSVPIKRDKLISYIYYI